MTNDKNAPDDMPDSTWIYQLHDGRMNIGFQPPIGPYFRNRMYVAADLCTCKKDDVSLPDIEKDPLGHHITAINRLGYSVEVLIKIEENSPATSSAAVSQDEKCLGSSSGTNAAMSLHGEPADAQERGKCWRCGGEGVWMAGADQGIPVECSPCPAPEREYNDKGWLITDRPGAENSTGAQADITFFKEAYEHAWKWVERLIWDKKLSDKECIGALQHSPYAPWNHAPEKWDTSHKEYDDEIKAVAAKDEALREAAEALKCCRHYTYWPTLLKIIDRALSKIEAVLGGRG